MTEFDDADSFLREREWVVLLSAEGSGNLKLWKQSSVRAVQKVFDHSIKTYAFQLTGIPSTAVRISYPQETKTSLGLPHPFLVIQLKVSETRDFSFELIASDCTLTRRKLQYSTFYKEIQIGPQAAKLPLQALVKDQWCNVCVPVRSLLEEFWSGKTFLQLDSVAVCANSWIRRVFVLRSDPLSSSSDGKELGIPQQLQLERKVNTIQVLDAQSLTSKGQQVARNRHGSFRSRTGGKLHSAEIGSATKPPRNKISSAPTPVRDFRRGSLGSRASSSASLPRIRTAEKQPSMGDLSSITLPPEDLKPTVVSERKIPIMMARRQAWRGASAVGARKLPENTESLPKKDEPANLAITSLKERIAAALRGPDELVCVEESEDELCSGRKHHIHRKVRKEKIPDMEAYRPKTNEALTVKNTVDFEPEIDYETLELVSRFRAEKVPPFEPEKDYNSPVYYEPEIDYEIASNGAKKKTQFEKDYERKSRKAYFEPEKDYDWKNGDFPVPVLDDDELAVLASMKRSALNASKRDSGEETQKTSAINSLKRHEYFDEDDDDWPLPREFSSGANSRNQSRNEMAMFALDSSLSDSLLSSRLRRVNDEQEFEAMTKTTVEKEDSGVEEGEEACPTMELIFDPDLNLFFHPVTKQFFQVSS